MLHFLYFTLSVVYRISLDLINILSWRLLYGIKWKNSTLYEMAQSKHLYILGTGASVNTYSNSDWDEIRNGYSIGLNMWVMHDFVPNMYFLELLSEDERYLDNLLQILKARQHQLTETKIYIKSNYLLPWRYKLVDKFLCGLPYNLKKNTFFISDFPITGLTLENYERSIKWLNLFGFFDVRTQNFRFTAQARASLGFAVIFGIQNGFKKIVLCGVDLNNDKHFYDGNSYYFEKFKIFHVRSKRKILRHLTNDPNEAEVTISEALYYLDRLVCQQRGILIKVGSRKSDLYPKFAMAFREVNEEIVP